MKTFLKKWDYLLITFICALIVIISVYVLQKVSPFGEHSLLTIDFFHQYGPMLGELYDRIHNGSNLIYSFNMGMGLPFFRNFFNYLSSPFNIIILLFKHKDLLMSYSFIIGLKAVASACTMCFYLNNKFKKNYLFIALSILYAFCAYFTAYYWNIMWLDGLVMLPLVTYGIELLVNKNKILVYVVSLAVMLFANYFIGFMMCIFSVLYFMIYLFITTSKFNFKKVLKKCLYFGISSLIAGGLCAIFLIPLFFALRGISATSDTWPTSQYYDFTLLEFIFNHFSGIGSTVLKSGITNAPNVSVGVLPIALLFLFIINPKIGLKIKIGYILLLAFLILSYVIAPLDFIWHAFHVPNDLPYRYSFIYSFVMIIISAYSISKIKNIKSIWIGLVYVLVIGLITIMKFSGYENISNDMIIMNYIIITITYLSYIIYKYFSKYKAFAGIFIILTATLECIMVVNNNWNIDQSIKGFYSDYNDMLDVLKYIKDNDNEMYRVEKDNMLTFNDPSWYGYYGQIAFSSMEYENMAILQHSLGQPGNEINSYYYKQNTPIYNLMFNIEYLVGNNKDYDRYSLYYSNDLFDVNKNNYNIGLMYGVNKRIINWKGNFTNPFLNQNDYIYKSTDVSDILEKIDYTKNIIYDMNDKLIVKYSFKNNLDNFYLYYDSYNIDFLVVNGTMYYYNENYNYINDLPDIIVNNHVSYNERFIINEISDNNVVDFYVGYENYYNDDIYLYSLNQKKLDKVYTTFINNKLDINVFKENYIRAFSNNNDDLIIYTSIPYDEGWSVYVDGKKQDTIEIADALLGFELSSGEHEIELKYHIPYFMYGLLITTISLIGLIILVLKKKD